MGFYDSCRGALFHPGGIELTKRGIAACNFPQGAVIADIGCGTGDSAYIIEENFPVRVINVEPSAAMAQGNREVISASAERLPFEDGSLDGALCECVLSLCDDLDDALRELGRVLKPSGYLIVSDVYSKDERFVSQGAAKWFYPKVEFFARLRDKGFEIPLFEDHSRELAIMTARLIMEGRESEFIIEDKKKAGYFLLIARK